MIEREGINRAMEKIALADLVLFVLDGSRSFDKEDQLIFDALQQRSVIAVINKSDVPTILDLPRSFEAMPHLSISTESGEGVELLKDMIKSLFISKQSLDNREFIALSHARHRDVLDSANSSLQRFIDGLAVHCNLELLAIDLRDALTAVGSVTGQVTNDDVLDIIFSSFCIGK
jgi:tRNA modification GTPase